MNSIKSKDALPKETHFAAIVFKSRTIHHEGDERSRTNPGHGYPESWETVNHIEYVPFHDRDAMEAWVLKAETAKYDQPSYRIIEARPLSAQITASVQIQ